MASRATASLRRQATTLLAAPRTRGSMVTTTTTAVRMPWAAGAASTRTYAQFSRGRVNRVMDQQQKNHERYSKKEQAMSEMQKSAAMDVFKDGGGPLFPGTFVPLALSERSKNPLDFAQYQWWRAKAYVAGLLSVLTVKLRSMPSWRSRPKYQAGRSKVAPTARAMYREMLEAFAAGDKTTIARLCQPKFAAQLNSAIDRRNPKETVKFEYVKNTRSLFYPKLVSHLIHPANPHDKTALTEQAVVALSSQQQMSRHVAATGQMIPGSLRLQDKVEYVVLARGATTTTYRSSPWRIWGTVTGTTPGQYLEEQAVIMKESAHRAGWKSKDQLKEQK